MKKSLFVVLLSVISVASFAQNKNGLENIIVERYYISEANDTTANSFGGNLPIGSVTYRVYVDMLPEYKFQAAFGIPGHELRIETTTFFFNNTDHGGNVANVIPYRNLDDNTVMLDSWLSVGAAAESDWGVLKTEDDTASTIVNSSKKKVLQNENPLAGIPIKMRDGILTLNDVPPRVTGFGIDSIISVFSFDKTPLDQKKSFITSDGSWASLNGTKGPTPENRVLIGQFTTNGKFSFELNIQIGTPNGKVEQYVAKNPGEGQTLLPSLSFK
jgi:hypothetical protein